jgi:hypothetical protein
LWRRARDVRIIESPRKCREGTGPQRRGAMPEPGRTPSILSYEPKEGERRTFWNAGNVSLVMGAALLLSIWVGVPSLLLGSRRVQEILAPFSLGMFAVWMVAPAVGVLTGIVGIARRAGRSAALGIVVNLMCWPMLVLMCCVCLMRR